MFKVLIKTFDIDLYLNDLMTRDVSFVNIFIIHFLFRKSSPFKTRLYY